MAAWLRSPNSRKSLNDWADDVASGTKHSDKDRRSSSRGSRYKTPTTSTTVNESLPTPATHTDHYSIASSHRKRRKKSARFSSFGLWLEELCSKLGAGSAPSSTSIVDESTVESSFPQQTTLVASDDGAVDEVVVDRVWSDEFHSTLSNSENDDSPQKSRSHHGIGDTESGGTADESVTLRSRIWHVLMEIFSSRFEDDKKEEQYQKEDWYMKKNLAMATALWLLLSWILGCAFSKLPGRSWQTGDKIFFLGVAPAFTIPILPMVLFNWPRDRSHLYQVILLCAVWSWSFYNVIFIRVCNYYVPSKNTCLERDFMSTFYYTTGLQVVGMFGLKLNRFPAAIGALCFFLFSSIAIVLVRPVWVRNMINFFIFHTFLIYVHYIRESSERRLYTLRDQLKMQYKATQKAQINERKASDSKRRLTSYVFHEVRVPLNTALLAVQNMGASGTVAKDQEIEFSALSGSLSMMSKVLNDVLDFNRLDSGKFESASKPYAFHQVMRSLFIPLRLATDARGLEFEAHLDPNIDKLARRLAYEAMGETQEACRRHILAHPDVDGVVTGDEARLRQIVTNLASNACKFTPAGGKLTITTKLVLPKLAADDDPLDVAFGTDPPVPPGIEYSTSNRAPDGDEHHSEKHPYPPLSANHLTQHNIDHGGQRKTVEFIVVRIEIADTGCGIRSHDMVHNKLFSAFNQTEQGIQQGGKGTGLGLALVRQIVKLSGGRLGVRSKPDEGSTFWVELPLGVGRRTFQSPPTHNGIDTSTPPSDTSRHARGGEWAHPSRPQPGVFETSLNDRIVSENGERMRAAKIKAEAMREHQALYTLMEQGGRVDLAVRKKRESNQYENLPSDLRPQSQILVGSASGEELTSPPPMYHREDSSDTSRLTQEEGTFGETPGNLQDAPGSGRRNRPTYVQMPNPRIFSPNSTENQAPLTSSTYQSSVSTSPMTAFDNCFTHGSPASSNGAVDIEPGMSVLVVDDDPLTRTLMTRILSRLGCKVTTAENGEMAIDLILGAKGFAGVQTTPGKEIDQPRHSMVGHEEGSSSRNTADLNLGPVPDEIRFSVVFLDNQMPVMSGVKAVERLRALGRRDFVVGVTGNALLTDQHEYLAAGVDKILTKPVLERSLREILSAAEERRRATLKEARLSLKDSLSATSHGRNTSLEIQQALSSNPGRTSCPPSPIPSSMIPPPAPPTPSTP